MRSSSHARSLGNHQHISEDCYGFDDWGVQLLLDELIRDKTLFGGMCE